MSRWTANTYLTGEEALDVARLTGQGVSAPGHRFNDPPDLSPVAVDHGSARGMIDRRRVFIDLSRLSWWDRWQIFWARVGGHTFLKGNHHNA